MNREASSKKTDRVFSYHIMVVPTGFIFFTCFKVLVQDWFKDSQSQIRVRTTVEEILDKDLPETNAKDLFCLKSDKIFELVYEYALTQKMQLIYIHDRHMGIKTFTKQNLVVLYNHNTLHENVQVCFERIPHTKELLVKLLLPICLPPYPMFCIFRGKRLEISSPRGRAAAGKR